MCNDNQGSEFYSEKILMDRSSSNLLSENLEICSRFEAALDELNEAEAQISVLPSYPAFSDNSFDLDRVRVARLKCYEVAQDVMRSHPQTCLEKITMLDLITVYLTIADLDHLERYKLCNSNLISNYKNNRPAPCVSAACLHSLTSEPGAKR